MQKMGPSGDEISAVETPEEEDEQVLSLVIVLSFQYRQHFDTVVA